MDSMDLDEVRDFVDEIHEDLETIKLDLLDVQRDATSGYTKSRDILLQMNSSAEYIMVEALVDIVIVFFAVFHACFLPCDAVTVAASKPSLRAQCQVIRDFFQRQMDLLKTMASHFELSDASLSKLKALANVTDPSTIKETRQAISTEMAWFKGHTKSLRELFAKVRAEGARIKEVLKS